MLPHMIEPQIATIATKSISYSLLGTSVHNSVFVDHQTADPSAQSSVLARCVLLWGGGNHIYIPTRRYAVVGLRHGSPAALTGWRAPESGDIAPFRPPSSGQGAWSSGQGPCSCIVLSCSVLYCIVLYCTVLYCTLLYRYVWKIIENSRKSKHLKIHEIS